MGIQTQLKIAGTAGNFVSNQLAKASVKSIQSSWNRATATTNNSKPKIRLNCGYAWSASHR